MRILTPFVLVAALVAAPAAEAQQLCDAINHAAKVGRSDYRFAAFRRKLPAPEGFTCRIITGGGFGAYACSTPVAPDARVAKARALIDTVRACVRSSLLVEKSPREANTMFIVSRTPPSWVMVDGANINNAEDATRVTMYVVAAQSDRPRRAPSPDRPLVGQGIGGADTASQDDRARVYEQYSLMTIGPPP